MLPASGGASKLEGARVTNSVQTHDETTWPLDEALALLVRCGRHANAQGVPAETTRSGNARRYLHVARACKIPGVLFTSVAVAAPAGPALCSPQARCADWH